MFKIKWLKADNIQTLIASWLCVLIGLLLGLVTLYLIQPKEAFEAFSIILKDFMIFSLPEMVVYYFGSTLVKAAPLIMCTLSVIFAYKAGLFNIGTSGQYTVGAGISLYLGIALKMPWYICILGAVIGGALTGALIGVLKAYRNVNEVIAGIMINWIALYGVNMLLLSVKETSGTHTLYLPTNAIQALIPSCGLSLLFGSNEFVTLAVPTAFFFAVGVWFVMEKTRLGYELRATGLNRNAAVYAGMNASHNIVLTMAISGALAALGACFLYLSGIEQWDCSQTTVPAMGFNGVAAAFLGALHPLGAVISGFFIQHITSGGSYVDKMIYCSEVSDLITAIIIYFCGFVFFFKDKLRELWQEYCSHKDTAVAKGGDR